LTNSYKQNVPEKGRVMAGKLGIRLRRAREGLGLTQEDLSKSVGLSSEFISLLEIGKRSPSLDSLRRIAEFLKKDVGYFLQDREEDFNVLLQDKRLNLEARRSIRRLQRYCEDYIRLEDLTARHTEPAPLYFSISAERLAQEERNRLGLGAEPIRKLFGVVEANGLKILRQWIPEQAKIAVVFVNYSAEQASFAMINASRPLGDQIVAAAHAYAHYLKDRQASPILDNPDVLVDDYLPLYHPREKFAQTFALQFLVPPAKLRQLVAKEMHGRSLHFEDVVHLKRYFGLTMATMLQVLHKRGFIPSHRYQEFQATDAGAFERSLFGRISDAERSSKSRPKSIPSDRYKLLGVSACQKISKEKG
jgi:transcriptional regulator with XRE-family HTH domain/Zn-dependent peptidase ImmA (M78 family)